MPNWCSNSVYITSDDATKLQELKSHAEAADLFQAVSPVGPIAPDRNGANRIDAQIAAWGTKWEVSRYNRIDLDNNVLALSFDSAWAPPIQVYEKLVEQGFGVKAFYFEPGINFAGIWEDGDDLEYDDAIESAKDGSMDGDLFEEMFIQDYLDDMEEDDLGANNPHNIP
jgi:hypothetical protein